MPAKISEKKLLIGITTLVTGILIFIKTTITAAPVIVSEKGVLSAGAALFLIAITLFGRAILRSK